MRYFGVPIRNGLAIGLGAVMSLVGSAVTGVLNYLMTEGNDNLVTENNERILLEQDYG